MNNAILGNAIRSNGMGDVPANQEVGGILLTAANTNQIVANNITSNTGSGVVLFNGATGNALSSNTITSNSTLGVYIFNAPGNQIGLNGAGNTISDNSGSGVDLEGAMTGGNTVLANMILRNGENGVYVFNATGNAIGGTNAGDGNTIQNNGFSGVDIDSPGATMNRVQGNTIADHAAGYGVLLDNGATQNTVGGSGGAANTFRNNALGDVQVLINGLPPSGNVSGGNTIGPNTSGGSGLAIASRTHATRRLSLKSRHHAHAQRVSSTGHHPTGPKTTFPIHPTTTTASVRGKPTVKVEP
jgi:parallel beta-helix repeat protein